MGEMRMEFKDFASDIGIGQAVDILFLGGKLTLGTLRYLLNNLSIQELEEVYNKSSQNILKRQVENEMKQRIKGFSEWMKILEGARGEVGRFILIETIESAETFDQYMGVFRKGIQEDLINDPQRRYILGKALELAEKFDELKELIEWVPKEDPEFRKVLLKKMVKIAERSNEFNEWRVIYDVFPKKSEERENALMRMTELAREVKDWISIYNRARDGSYISKLARSHILFDINLKEMKKDVKGLLDLYGSPYVEIGLRDVAGEKVIRLIKENYKSLSFDDLYTTISDDLLMACTSAREIEEIIKEELLKKAKTFDEWMKLIKIEVRFKMVGPNEEDKQPLLYENAFKLAETFEQIKKVYEKLRIAVIMKGESIIEEEKVLRKMLEKAKDFQEAWIVYQYIDRNEKSTKELRDLRNKAFNKAVSLAREIDDWDKIYNSEDANEEVKKEALKKMLNLATDLHQLYYNVYLRTVEEGREDLRREAAVKIAKRIEFSLDC